MRRETVPPEWRFWTKVVPNDETGCWEWQGCKHKGYGCFMGRGPGKWAHRYAYILCVGEIPEGLQVCHHCDNPSCCNPAHLFLGTFADNMRDKVLKNRQWKPPRRSHCKRGHVLQGENVAFYANGSRHCRVCVSDRQKAKYWAEKSRVNLATTAAG